MLAIDYQANEEKGIWLITVTECEPPAGNFSSVYDWPLMAMFGIDDVKQRCSTATFQTYIVGIIDGICPLFPTMILAVFDR